MKTESFFNGGKILLALFALLMLGVVGQAKAQGPTFPASVEGLYILVVNNNDYSAVSIAATGGTAPLMYSTSPALPADLRITSAGLLATVNDMAAVRAVATYTLTVTDSAATPLTDTAQIRIITTEEFPTLPQAEYSYVFVEGVASTVTLPQGNSSWQDELIYQLTSRTSLETAGFTLSDRRTSYPHTVSSTSSTPATAGVVSPYIVIYNTNNGIAQATASITFIVASEVGFTANQPDIAFTAGFARTVALDSAVGGATPYTYALTRMGGAFPTGILSLDTTDAMLTASASIAPSHAGNYILTVTDNDGDTAATTFAITIADRLQFASTANPGNQTFANNAPSRSINLGFATGGAATVNYKLENGGTAVAAGEIVAGSGLTYTAISGSTAATISGSGLTDNTLQLEYIATDANGASVTFAFTIRARNAPYFAAAIGDLHATAGFAKTFTAFTAATSGSPPLTYSLLRPGGSVNSNNIEFDPTNLVLRTTASATASDSGGYRLMVIDADNIYIAQNDFTLTIAPQLRFPATANPGDMAVLTTIAANIELGVVEGGRAPVVYVLASASGGTINNGDTFSDLVYTAPTGNTDGSLVGTPTALGVDTYTLTATDANSEAVSYAFELSVVDKPTFTSADISVTYTQNHALFTDGDGMTSSAGDALTLPKAAGGVNPTYAVVVSNLPNGLTAETPLASGEQVISGTPTAAGAFTFSRSAVDSVGGDTFTLTGIVAAELAITSSVAELHYTAAESRVNSPFTATGGATPLVYSLTDGDGMTQNVLTFDTATGEIGSVSGILGIDSGDYIMTVTDINMATASVTFAIQVETALALANPAALSFTLGHPSVLEVTAATNGFAPLSYSLANGTDNLPAFLTVIDGGRMVSYSGATTAAGQAIIINLVVTDQKSPTAQTVTKPITAYVLISPSFASNDQTALSNGYTFRVGKAIAANTALPTAASGGATPNTYQLTVGTNSAFDGTAFNGINGINFDAATRILSGTPTATQTHQLRYHVRDKNGATGSQAVNIVVPDVLSLADVADQNVGTLQAGVSIQLPAATNTVGAITYNYAGTLPAGLAFDTATQIISGDVTATTAQAAQAITYTAYDQFDGATASVIFNIAVTAGPAFSPNAFAATYTVGAISYTNSGGLAAGLTIPAAIGGSGAAGDTTYAVTTNQLPNGITATEQADNVVVISATAPTVSGEFTYTRTATDTLGREGTYTLTVNVVDAATFSGDQGNLGFTIGHTPAEETTLPSADGGFGALVLTLTPDLPSGMMLSTYSSTGQPLTMGIAGTPDTNATVGSENYTLTVTDANGSVVTDTFAIRVAGMIMPGDMIADPFTFEIGDVTEPLPVAGQGQSPFTYALDGLDATTGLTFDANARTIAAATLSITAESQLQQMLTYSITDANGATTFDAFTFDIIPIRFEAENRDALFTDSASTYDLTAQLRGVAESSVVIGYAIDPQPNEAGLTYTFNADNNPVLESDGTYGIEQDPQVLVYTFTATFGTSDVVATQVVNIRFAQTKRIMQINAQLVSKVAAASVAGTMGAITDRLAAASSVAPQFSIGGQSPLVALAQNVKAIADDTFDKNQLLANSRFILPFSAGGGAISNGAIWGSAHYRRLNGESAAVALDNTPQIDWSGDVSGLHLGVDFEVADNILVGAAVSQSTAEMNYETLDSGGKVEKGDYEITLSGLHPYINWRFGETNLWASAGYGAGDVTVSPKNPTQVEAVSDVSLVALGVGVSDEINPRLQLRLEARAAEIDIEGNDERTILQQDLDTNTARVLVKWHDANTRSDNRAAFVEIGLRHDDGDGDTGAAMEAALGWNYLGRHTTLEAGAHGLFGRKNYNEWGAYGNFRVSGGGDGQGFALRIRPSYGDEVGEFGRVWNAESFDDIDAGDSVDANYAWRTESRLSYGIQSAGGLVVPFFDAVTANSASDDIYRLGVDWSPHRYFDLNLTGERRLNNDDADEQRIFVQGAVKF